MSKKTPLPENLSVTVGCLKKKFSRPSYPDFLDLFSIFGYLSVSMKIKIHISKNLCEIRRAYEDCCWSLNSNVDAIGYPENIGKTQVQIQ